MTKSLLTHIQNEITLHEKSIGFTLRLEDRQLLVETIVDFISKGIPKFIKGGQEHNNNLSSIDAKAKLWNELFDGQIYLKVLEFKLRKL